MGRIRNDYDSPWKEALELFFRDFLALTAPDVHRAVDWSKPVVFLDKELQNVVRGARSRRAIADKLVQVHLKGGEELWILIHVEVQSSSTSRSMAGGTRGSPSECAAATRAWWIGTTGRSCPSRCSPIWIRAGGRGGTTTVASAAAATSGSACS